MKVHFSKINRTVWFRKETLWVSQDMLGGLNAKYVVDALKDLNFKRLEQKHSSGDGMAGDAHW